MATGYEIKRYHDIARIACALEGIERALEKIAQDGKSAEGVGAGVACRSNCDVFGKRRGQGQRLVGRGPGRIDTERGMK